MVIDAIKEKGADFFVMQSGNANFFYATKFRSSSMMFYIAGIDGTELLILPEMELRRSLRESKVKEIASYEMLGYEEKIKELKNPKMAIAEILVQILKEGRAKKVVIPNDFPSFFAFVLQKNFEVEVIDNPFTKLRAVKNSWEIAEIRENCQKIIQVFPKIIKIVQNNKKLLCEEVRNILENELWIRGLISEDTICSTGKLSADPHEVGSGEIEDHLLIDVFPRNRKGYYADFTRTVILNQNPELKEMLSAVIDAQKVAFRMLKEGVNGKDVHSAVKDELKSHGFETRKDEGFIHSTGHGIGLEIHEEPRIGDIDVELRSGMVVTVEPGLYYKNVGGVRVEDVVLIKKDGCEILTPFERFLA